MAALVQGLYQPLRAYATGDYSNYRRSSPAAHLAATALKIGIAVASYFAFAAVMAHITSSWMALGAGIGIYIGMQMLINPEISDGAVGVWLLLTGIKQIAARALWQTTGLGVVKVVLGVAMLATSDGSSFDSNHPYINMDRFF